MKINSHFLYLIPFIALFFFIPDAVYASRIYGGFYTEARITNLRNNCKKYDWAKKMQDAAIKHAQPWLEKSDIELWEMVPGQDLPRCIDVTFDRLTTGPKTLGCLNCGKKIVKYGNYPYDPDIENKPWKLTCPSCKIVFPTNDFGKYYRSGIDQHGLFNPSKADRSLLYNTEHPDPADPLHKFGVDDGYGYIDKNGRAHKFIGYYTWKYWRHLNGGLAALANAYLYTGDKQYAHKAAIILDRIADVYPDMDWKPYADRGWYHSDGNSGLGKIEGSIWETGTVQTMADAYDKIISGTTNDSQLYQFLNQQSKKHQLPGPKGSRDKFIQNVDNGLLRAIYKGVQTRQIKGNQGMHQLSMAVSALALNTNPETTEWLDWIFDPKGGNLPGLMIANFDHDGTTDEGAPGYSFMWGDLVTKIADRLTGYSEYTKHDIIKAFPQFGTTFLAAYRMAALGYAIPNIGDSGSTGLVHRSGVKPDFMAKGYFLTRNPELAIAAYQANRNSTNGLYRNIFSEDPDAVIREIQQIAEKAGPRPEGGYLMSGFGLALLESGTGKSGIALASNYGRTIKHAHPDMLNFDLLAFGKWLAPDHGYPEFATNIPVNNEWTGTTISHNTVLVDQKPQKEIWSGHSQIFKQLKGFGVFELEGKKAYPGVKDYTRTMFLINADRGNAYVVDIFRVSGGQDHVYSFHGPPGVITNTGLRLQEQKNGTYAGYSIPKGAKAKGFPVGYSFLYNVRKDGNPPAQFTLDWKAEAGYHGLKEQDGVHLRMHALTQSDDVALADGDPPQNKAGNPDKLGYVLMHRKGNDLNSTYVSVLEPYKQTPFIKSVKRLDNTKAEEIILEIELVSGSVDYLMYNTNTNKTIKLKNGISLAGTAGYLRKTGNDLEKSILINGTSLKFKNTTLSSTGPITGKIVKMNKELAGGGWLLVDTALPINGSLIGEQIIISTESDRDASYTIRSIEKEGSFTKVSCGPISFVKGAKSPDKSNTYPSNTRYLYDFEEGSSFRITSHTEWNKK